MAREMQCLNWPGQNSVNTPELDNGGKSSSSIWTESGGEGVMPLKILAETLCCARGISSKDLYSIVLVINKILQSS